MSRVSSRPFPIPVHACMTHPTLSALPIGKPPSPTFKEKETFVICQGLGRLFALCYLVPQQPGGTSQAHHFSMGNALHSRNWGQVCGEFQKEC